MLKKKLITALLCFFLKQAQAQNWEPVPCFNASNQLYTIFVDSLHDEIIINFFYDYKVCNKEFKGLLAYNGNSFRDLDIGIQTHDTLNKNPGGRRILGCTRYENQTLFGGIFSSVGSNVLHSEAMALWNGATWDTFPKKAFRYNPNGEYSLGSVHGFFKADGKLWIHGVIDTLGGIPGKNLFTYDGNNFNAVNIPANTNDNVHKIIKYKDELYFTGAFYNWPYDSINKIIRYNNGTWKSVGNGIKAPLGGPWDMIVYKDTLYVGGEFAKADGNAGNNLMKWDGVKFIDAGFGGFYGWGGVRQLIVYKNRLYAFGRFTYAADKKAFGAAYYENGKWTVNTDSMDNVLMSAVLYKNEIYVSGGFTSIKGDNNIRYFAKLRCPDFDGCKNVIGHPDSETGLFPNPASSEINIHIENAFRYNSTISVYNDLGQLIFTNSINDYDFKINCALWAKGIYLINIQNNNKRIMCKVVKE